MNAKEAVGLAKDYIRDLFKDEGILNLGLEEVDFDDNALFWNITIGFSRPWDKSSSPLAAITQPFPYLRRSYKVVSIDERSGQVRSVKDRESKS